MKQRRYLCGIASLGLWALLVLGSVLALACTRTQEHNLAGQEQSSSAQPLSHQETKEGTVFLAEVLPSPTAVATESASDSAQRGSGKEPEGLIASPEPDWPQWRGPRRDGIWDEKGLLPSWPEGGPKLVWKIGGLGRGWSSPIVLHNTLYITGDMEEDLMIFALDAQEGSILWKTKNGQAWKGSYPGSRASCTYSEGRLYHLNAHGRLACLDARSGQELWAVQILQRFDAKNITWALSECVLVEKDRVWVTPGGPKALMAALNKNTGQTLLTTPPLDNEPTSHCSPILFRYAGRRVIAQCSASHGFGIDADTGQLLWTVPLRNPYFTNVSTPIFAQGAVYYVTPYAELGRLYRLRPTPEGIQADHVWSCLLDSVTGSGVYVDGVLYSAGYQKTKWWFAVDWDTGKTLAELREFTTGAPLYADGRLYILDERGQVGLLKPHRDRLEIISRFRLVEEKVRDAWAHPVLCNGRLYLRYHEHLWCYDVRESAP